MLPAIRTLRPPPLFIMCSVNMVVVVLPLLPVIPTITASVYLAANSISEITRRFFFAFSCLDQGYRIWNTRTFHHNVGRSDIRSILRMFFFFPVNLKMFERTSLYFCFILSEIRNKDIRTPSCFT